MGGPPGRIKEARVVGHQVQTAELDAVRPANPAVARPALQRRRREHHQRQPAPPMVRDIAHRLAHPRYRPEIVVRLHQVAEADLVRRRHDVHCHLRKNPHRLPVPTAAWRHSYRNVAGKSSVAVNSLAHNANAQRMHPPWLHERCRWRTQAGHEILTLGQPSAIVVDCQRTLLQRTTAPSSLIPARFS